MIQQNTATKEMFNYKMKKFGFYKFTRAIIMTILASSIMVIYLLLWIFVFISAIFGLFYARSIYKDLEKLEPEFFEKNCLNIMPNANTWFYIPQFEYKNIKTSSIKQKCIFFRKLLTINFILLIALISIFLYGMTKYK